MFWFAGTRHWLKIKFILVGIWNTFFGYFIFIILDTLFSQVFLIRFMAYMMAMFLANIIAILNAFIFHKYLTFRSKVKGRAMLLEFIRFLITYLFTFLLSLILLPIFVEFIHLTPKMSGAIILLICALISYVGHSRFSFPWQKAKS